MDIAASIIAHSKSEAGAAIEIPMITEGIAAFFARRLGALTGCIDVRIVLSQFPM